MFYYHNFRGSFEHPFPQDFFGNLTLKLPPRAAAPIPTTVTANILAIPIVFQLNALFQNPSYPQY